MRPMDFLGDKVSKHKKVVVTTRDGKEYFGMLVAFDISLNLVIATEDGNIFIRGGEVVTIT